MYIRTLWTVIEIETIESCFQKFIYIYLFIIYNKCYINIVTIFLE